MYYVKFGPEGYRIKPVVPPHITDDEEKKRFLERAKNGESTLYNEGCELVEEVTFSEISPEELKKRFEEEKKRIEDEIERTWEEMVRPHLGKRFERGDSVIEKIRGRFVTRTRMEVIAEIENIHNLPKRDIVAFTRKIEEYEPQKNLIYLGEGKIHVDGYCDDEDIEVECVSYVIDVLVPVYPDEKNIERLAMQRALYKYVGKAFRFDCEAVRDYMEGDLTFKGLVKKIDPRKERKC